MEDSRNQWLWFIDDELVRAALAVEPENPGLLRRAATHPALVRSVQAKIRGKADEALSLLAPALEGGDPDAVALAAQIYFETGRIVEAAQAYEQLAGLRPDELAPVFNRGLCLVRTRRWPAAVECFQKAVLLAPEKPEVWHGLGVCLLNQRRAAEARSAFAHSLRLRSDYAPAWFGQAVALQLEQKHQEALEIYERLLEAQPDREEVLANALIAAVALKSTGTIHALAMHLLGLRPTSIPALLALAAASAEEQNFDEARRWCSRLIELEPGCYEHWHNLGLCLHRMGDRAGAQEAFANALRLNSDGVDAWRGMAQCAAETEQPARALEAWRSIARIEPENAGAWFQAGLLWYDAGDLENAASAFDRCSSLEPEWQAAWLNLGACRWEAGEEQPAETAFEKALALGELPAGPASALVSLAARRGDLETALRRRHELKVTDPAALFDLAVLHQANGQFAEAAALYEEILRADSGFAEASFNLGSVLLGLGRGEESSFHWRTALQTAPELAHHLVAAGQG